MLAQPDIAKAGFDSIEKREKASAKPPERINKLLDWFLGIIRFGVPKTRDWRDFQPSQTPKAKSNTKTQSINESRLKVPPSYLKSFSCWMNSSTSEILIQAELQLDCPWTLVTNAHGPFQLKGKPKEFTQFMLAHMGKRRRYNQRFGLTDGLFWMIAKSRKPKRATEFALEMVYRIDSLLNSLTEAANALRINVGLSNQTLNELLHWQRDALTFTVSLKSSNAELQLRVEGTNELPPEIELNVITKTEDSITLSLGPPTATLPRTLTETTNHFVRRRPLDGPYR